ncbi:fatty acid-binding protein-like [Aricia agestis]|uniref:fatty acid-binding protein-like n=1 Tax=Aricia agestis TaxID=91739 RepID=UPI001C20B69C|nr:fatty acid-binding protein-like [Aricia agestis]
MYESASLRAYSLKLLRKRNTTHDMGAAQSDSNISKKDLVSRIKQHVESADREKAKEIGGVFLFNIIKDTTVYSWTMDLNKLIVYEGEPAGDPDTTFTLNEHHFKQLVTGREEARVIMQAGRCSVTGDVMRAMKLEPYIKLGDKLRK